MNLRDRLLDLDPARGDELTVAYESRRSGTLVERTGTVTEFGREAGETFLDVTLELRSGLDRLELAVVQTEDDTDPHAFTLVTGAGGGMSREVDEATGTTTYAFGREVKRNTYLGVVEAVEVRP